MLEVAVYNVHQHFQQSVSESSFTLGSKPIHAADAERHVAIDDTLVSPLQCQVEVSGDDGQRVAITNLGHSLVLSDGSRLAHGLSREMELPCGVVAGNTQLQFCPDRWGQELDGALDQLPVIGSPSSLESARRINAVAAPSAATLSSWFEALGQLGRSTAGESEFFELAARSVYNPGGLDGSIILARQGTDWKIISQYIPYPDYGIHYRKDLVEKAVDLQMAIFHDGSSIDPNTVPHDLHAAVICPVMDDQRNVIAVVYGFRALHRKNNRTGIRMLEAQFVRLIADSIAAGMIRLQREADSAKRRILLQQAFSPEVARRLENSPEILQGQDREVSVLFADLRSFCSISEKLGARLTHQLLTNVMDCFTQIIQEHDGVLIDFYGDGLSAFWNAPMDQPNHALLACQAAEAIKATMPKLNEEWSNEIGCRLQVGVGVHSGTAQVGNSGTRNRLKYGPQGTTVNIASRLEQATKKLGIGVLLSGETANQVADHFMTQRICSVQLAGIKSKTDLVRIVKPQRYSKMAEYLMGYQQALEHFEAHRFDDAIVLLTDLNIQFEADALIAFLMDQAVSRLATTNVNAREQKTLLNDSKEFFVLV